MTPAPQAPPLAVVEDDEACFVVCRDDRLDWLVRIEKDGRFPARAWADGMVATYNSRRSKGATADRPVSEAR